MATGVTPHKKITKKKLLIPISIFFIFVSIEVFNIILITGYTYMLDHEFLGFFSLFIQDTINYVGNLGVLYLFIIPIIGCYKGGYALRKIKDGFKLSNKFLVNLIIFLIFYMLSFFVIKYFEVNYFSHIILILSIILLFVLYLFITINRSEKYEIRF